MFCSFLISELSVRKAYESIDSLKSLVDSRIQVMVFKNIIQIFQNRSVLLDTIIENAIKDKTFLELGQWSSIEEEWIRGVADGRHAIMIFEMPFKMSLMKFSSKMSINFKVIYLNEFCLRVDPAIAFRRNLSKSFKQLFNLK